MKIVYPNWVKRSCKYEKLKTKENVSRFVEPHGNSIHRPGRMFWKPEFNAIHAIQQQHSTSIIRFLQHCRTF